MASEMLEITPSDSDEPVTALALNLEEDNIGAVILGDWTSLHEGDRVRRTGRVLDIPAGPGYVGRVVDALGEAIDGKGPIEPIEENRQIDVVAQRRPVARPSRFQATTPRWMVQRTAFASRSMALQLSLGGPSP